MTKHFAGRTGYIYDKLDRVVRAKREAVVAIFNREWEFIRWGHVQEYNDYWRDDLTNEEYEARKLLPEVPYYVWLTTPEE